MKANEQIKRFFAYSVPFIHKLEQSSLSTALDQNISIPEIRIINEIGPEGRPRMSELSTRLNVTPATLTDACDKLIQKDLISKRRDEEDKRAFALSLTPKGLAAYHFHQTFIDGLLDIATETLSEQEQKSFYSALRKVNLHISLLIKEY